MTLNRTVSLCTPALIFAFVALLTASCGTGVRSDREIEKLRVLIEEGAYVEAELHGRELLAATEQAHGERSIEVARALDLLVESLWRLGKHGEAETPALAARALAIKQAALGPDDASIATTLHNIAVINFKQGRFDDAQAAWERALKIREASLGEEDPAVAEILNGLANLKNITGDLAGCKIFNERALAIREKAFPADHRLIAQSLHNLSILLDDLGDYVGALALLEHSLQIKEKSLGREHPKTAEALNELARGLNNTGAYLSALPYLARARAIFEKDEVANGEMLGAVLINEGEALRETGDLPAAKDRYERALRIWEAALGSEHPDLSIPLGNLGNLEQRLDRFPAAIALHTRAVAALGGSGDEVALSLSRLDLARALLGAGKHGEALALFIRTVAELQQLLGPGHPFVAEALDGEGRATAIEGDLPRALQLALESEQIAREHRRLTGRSFSEARALQYAEAHDSGLDLALTIVASGQGGSSIAAAFDTSIRSRAIVLDGMAARHRTSVLQRDPQVAQLVRALSDARSRLARAVVGGPDDDVEEYRDFIDELRDTKDRAERALAASNLEFAKEQERDGVGLEQVLSSLPERSAIIAFVQFDPVELGRAATIGSDPASPYYVAFVQRARQRSPVVVPIGAAATIDPVVSAWKKEAAGGTWALRRSAEESVAAYRKAGVALRQLVWDPLAPLVAETERIFIVPDGSLNLISWAALPIGEAGFLIEHGPALHYLSAERDLVPSVQQSSIGQGLLALGAPDYDEAALSGAHERRPDAPAVASVLRGSGSTCANFSTQKFEPLPGARRELETIVATWREAAGERSSGEVQALSGAQASESAFKREAPGHRVLHLATHGYFLDGTCALAASGSRGLTLVREDPKPLAHSGIRVSPLLLSGLALAGANRRELADDDEEDGILTAEEIAGLDLSQVEWAVLSACDTGVGEIQPGEGVLGLRRAMQIAGVRSLIMSLWSVDDEATQSWMRALYEGRFEQDLDTATAVQRAGRSVLDDRRRRGESVHPFYWAAFVGAGDWR